MFVVEFVWSRGGYNLIMLISDNGRPVLFCSSHRSVASTNHYHYIVVVNHNSKLRVGDTSENSINKIQ